MNSNGPVPCQVLQTYPLSLDYVRIIRMCEVFESYCDLLCWPLTSMTSANFRHFDAACVCILGLPILSFSFSILSTFSRAFGLFLASMATLDGGDSDLPNREA